MPYFTYQQYQINYLSEGQGEKLLFLHGWPANSRLWEAQIDYFSPNYQVIAIDWLGFGHSDKPLQYHYTFTHQKDLLNTLLSELLAQNEPINIIAHDIGGPPAILWTHEHQEQVKRLILLNTVLFPFSTFLDQTSHFFFRVPLINDVMMSPFGLKILMRTLSNSNHGKRQQRINKIISTHKGFSKEIRLKTILEPLEEGKKKELLTLGSVFHQLKVPRHVIIAKKDPLCYAHMKKLIDLYPDIPNHHIAQSGHFIALDKPDELNEILNKILGGDN